MSNRVETCRTDCTGVSLPLRLLLFVYYNLDTIISLSSSRRSFRRYRCLHRARSLPLSPSRSQARSSSSHILSLLLASKCRWRARRRERGRKRNVGRRMRKRGKATETETYNKVSGRGRREWNCVAWWRRVSSEKVFVGTVPAGERVEVRPRENGGGGGGERR